MLARRVIAMMNESIRAGLQLGISATILVDRSLTPTGFNRLLMKAPRRLRYFRRLGARVNFRILAPRHVLAEPGLLLQLLPRWVWTILGPATDEDALHFPSAWAAKPGPWN